MASLAIALTLFFTVIAGCSAIRCYQCSSSQDPDGEDNCGAYERFDKQRNHPIECSSGESHMPGSFCVKLVKQGSIGFVWDGRWRQVTRQCASISNTGVTGACSWGVDKTGVYWEECYCSSDGCNGAFYARPSSYLEYAIIFVFVSFFLV